MIGPYLDDDTVMYDDSKGVQAEFDAEGSYKVTHTNERFTLLPGATPISSRPQP